MNKRLLCAMTLLAILTVSLLATSSLTDARLDFNQNLGEEYDFNLEGDEWYEYEPIDDVDYREYYRANVEFSSYGSNVEMEIAYGIHDNKPRVIVSSMKVSDGQVVNLDDAKSIVDSTTKYKCGLTDLGDRQNCVFTDGIPSELISTTVVSICKHALDNGTNEIKDRLTLSISSLKNIDDDMFKGYTSDLSKHDFSAVEFVGAYSFEGTNVSTSQFPSLKYIDKGGFKGVSFQEELYLPNVEAASYGAFAECSAPGILLPKMVFSEYEVFQDDKLAPFENASVGYIKLPSYPQLSYTIYNVEVDRVELDTATQQIGYFQNGNMIGTLVYGGEDASSLRSVYSDAFLVERLELPNALSLKRMGFSNNQFMKELWAPNMERVYEEAFRDAALEKIYMPNLEIIEQQAFKGCNLTEFNIDLNKIKSLGKDAFAYNQITSYHNNGAVSIPDYLLHGNPVSELDLTGAVYIGDYAFLDTKITKYTGAESVEVIGAHAFEGNQIEEFNFPAAVKVEDSAFTDSTIIDLVSDNLVYIGDYAFDNPPRHIDLPNLEHAGAYLFASGGFHETDLVFPKLTYAGNYAFHNNLFVSMPYKTLEYAGENSFEGNTMSELILPNLEVAYHYAFKNCGIKTVSLPSVKEIGSAAFEGNYFTSLDLPKLEKVWSHAFRGNPLEYINAPELNHINGSAFRDIPTLNKVIAPKVDYIGTYSFTGTNITEAIFPVATEINDYAFFECPITTLDIPNVKRVGDYAFCGCDLLGQELYYGSVEFGEYAFAYTNLESVELRGLEVDIGDYAFYMANLHRVELYVDGVVGNYSFANVNHLYTLRCEYPYVGDYAFFNLPYLENVVLKNISVLGTGAFEYSNVVDLSECYLSQIGENALRETPVEKVGLHPYKVDIGRWAFRDTNIQSITIGESLYDDYGVLVEKSTIGSEAFYKCDNLTEVNIMRASIESDAFNECGGMPHINVGFRLDVKQNDLTSYGDSFFDAAGAPLVKVPEGQYNVLVSEDDKYIAVDTDFRLKDAGHILGYPGTPVTPEMAYIPCHEHIGWTNLISGDGDVVQLKTLPIMLVDGRLCDEPYRGVYETFLEYVPYEDGGKLVGYDGGVPEYIDCNIRDGKEVITIRAIADHLFEGASDFKGMDLTTLYEIGDYAFANSGYEGLAWWDTLENLRYVGVNAFYGCSSLEGFRTVGDLDETDWKFSIWHDALYRVDDFGGSVNHHAYLVAYPADRNEDDMTVHADCIGIEDNACNGIRHAQYIMLPEGLRSIGSGSFADIPHIHQINIPGMVESISPDAFGTTKFYDDDRLMDMGELPGNMFVGDRDSMFVADSSSELIYLDPNGKDIEQPYPTYVEKDKNGFIVDMPEDPVCKGYVFIEWNSAPDGSGKTIDPSQFFDKTHVIYAIWEPEQYEIVYEDLRGADNSANPPTYTIEDEVVIKDPVRDSVTFVGWYWNGSDKLYSEPTISEGTTGKQVFTAVWDEVYTITYLGMEGAEDPGNPTQYKSSDEFTLLNPVKDGYMFEGWTGNGHESPTTKMTVYEGTTGNLEFTAHWNVITYSITYIDTGGVQNDNPTSYTVEDSFVLKDLSKEGYVFEGWYGPGAAEPVKGFKVEKGTTGDLEFTASWDYEVYSITYKDTDGTDNANPTSYRICDEIVLQDVSREAFDFLGWTGNGVSEPTKGLTIQKGTTGDLEFKANWERTVFHIAYLGVWNAQNDNPAFYNEGDSFTLKDPVHKGFGFLGWTGNGVTEPTKGLTVSGTTGDLVFVAHWDADEYSITYSGVEGADNSGNPDSYTVMDTVVLADASKANYEFLGWTGYGVTEPTKGLTIQKGTTGDLNFTANWKAIEYDVTYGNLKGADNSANPVKYTVEDSFVLNDLVQDGYTFLGWTGNGTTEPTKGLKVAAGTAGDLSFSAHWEAVIYSISYGNLKGADNSANPVKYTVEDSFVLNDLVQDGYTFLGWTGNGTTEPVKGLTVPRGTTGDLNFTANWDVIVYDITYVGIDGADNKGNPKEYTADDTIVLRNPDKAGYTFLGWTGNGFSEPVKVMKIQKGTTGDLTFTASWQFIEVEVELDMGDTVTDVKFDGKVMMSEDRTVSIPSAEPTADGYRFLGWFTAPEGGVQVEDGDVLEGDTLYAHWEAIVYSITYTGLDGAKNSANPATYTVEDSFRLYAPYKEGYLFLGWTGTGLSEATLEVTIQKGTTGDLEYEAHMEMIEYVIIYTWVQGADNGDNPTRYTVEDSFDIADPSREGYEFLGWTGTGITEPTKGVHIDAGTTGVLHFNAHWEVIEYSITYDGLEGAVNDNPSTYTVRDLPLKLNQPVREGYTFMGWDDGSKVSKDVTVAEGTTGDLEFTAIWEINVYKVTINAEGGKLTLNGDVVKAPHISKYEFGTPVTTGSGKLTIGTDVFTATHPEHDMVFWSVQDNLSEVVCDLVVDAVFMNSSDFITEVSINTMPAKTTYVLEERFDPAGLSLKVTYSSGISRIVSSGYTANPTVMTSLDIDHVDITFEGFTVECPVKVVDAIESIYISSPPDKTHYIYGSTFDPTGMEVTAKYISGKTQVVTDYTYSPEVLDSVGKVDIEVTYEGFVAYQEVEVLPMPEPADLNGYVRVFVDESGVITEDAVAAAILNMKIQASVNPGKPIAVEAISPVFEQILVPGTLTDAIRDYDASLIVTVKYGSVLLTKGVLSTEGVRGIDLEFSVKPTDGSSLPAGFLNGGRDYDVTLKADGKVISQFDAPVKIRLALPLTDEQDPRLVRAYHVGSEGIFVMDDVKSYLKLFVQFETDHFSEFVVKLSNEEHSVTTEVEGNGTVLVDPSTAEENVSVTVTVKAEQGYVLQKLTVDGKEVSVVDGKHVFQMPAADVIVKAVFVEGEPAPVDPEDDGSSGDSTTLIVIAVVVLMLVVVAAILYMRRKN